MKKCIICGKEFVSDKWHPFQQTCGNVQCNILRQRQKIAEMLARRRPKVKHCAICGKEFEPTKFNWKKVKWCSKCRLLAHKEIRRQWQKLHPSPSRSRKFRRNKWGGNWLKALERDKETCQICEGKGTQVHHINFSKKYNGSGSNEEHALENLQVLCAKCHLAIHHPTIRVDVASKKIIFSGLLFQIFPDFQITK